MKWSAGLKKLISVGTAVPAGQKGIGEGERLCLVSPFIRQTADHFRIK